MAVLSFITLAYLALSAAAGPAHLQGRQAKKNNFEFFGVNESGPEFGENTIPGALDKEYVWPNASTIDTFISKGMNVFRIAILAERMVTGKDQKGPVNEAYMADLKKTVDAITSKGAYAMINPHNYGRWYKEIRTNPKDFEAYWKNLATPFKDNKLVIFDTDNEFHDMPQSQVIAQNQAAINGIRAAGATTQQISVEGNSWTGAWHWVAPDSENSETMGKLTDTQPLIFQMHQYLDSDGSGTHAECVSATIGSERLAKATKWLRDNKKLGLIGEFAAGDNPTCKAAVEDMLAYMAKNNDVWLGALWWAAGPWWADYMYSMEPGTGKAYGAYMDLLMKYR